MLDPRIELILNGYFYGFYQSAVETLRTAKTLEILARKHYGDEAYEQAKREAGRTMPSWTTGLGDSFKK